MIQRIEKTNRPAEPAPKMVQVAPNRFVQLELGFAPPAMVISDVVEIPSHPGHFKLVPRSWEHLVHVTPELIERLGLGSSNTLRRLIRSGFVDGTRPSPNGYTVNLVSYFQHLKRCADNPDYWEDPKVRSEYNTAY